MDKSKIFIRMGELVGINYERKSQRGIIARKALKVLENYETEKMFENCKRITFDDRRIKVNEGGRSYFI